MTTIIILGSKSLLGHLDTLKQEYSENEFIKLEPLKTQLTEEDANLIVSNTGLSFLGIKYPHYIKVKEIGGIVDVSSSPLEPIEINESKSSI